MHGEDGENGKDTFHNTELVGLILIGGFASAETPEQLTPRKPGQVCGAALVWTVVTARVANPNNAARKVLEFMDNWDGKLRMREEQPRRI
jgi:hypothetical protein